MRHFRFAPLSAILLVASSALAITTGAYAAHAPKTTGAYAAHAPKLAETSFNALAQPLPYPYNERANAAHDVDQGLARARAEHKLLLVDMGGNWCGDCRVLAGTLALPDLESFVRTHYVVVTVDIGRFTKNTEIAHRFGAPAPAGVPALLIVDPRTLKLLDSGHIEALADARSMNPQALADWLAQWIRP